MFEIASIREELKGRGGEVVLYAGAVVLAVVLFGLSLYWDAQKEALMPDVGDCSWVHTLPVPELCKDRERVDFYQTLGNRSKVAFAGSLVLFGGILFVPILRRYRDEHGK